MGLARPRDRNYCTVLYIFVATVFYMLYICTEQKSFFPFIASLFSFRPLVSPVVDMCVKLLSNYYLNSLTQMFTANVTLRIWYG